MLLAIDIGNTNFTVGVFKEKELLATFRITTRLQRTSDEYGIVFMNLSAQEDLVRQTLRMLS